MPDSGVVNAPAETKEVAQMPTPPKHWGEFPLALTYGVTPVDPRRAEIGVYLLVDGEVIRYRMPVASAQRLAEMLGDYLESPETKEVA